MFTIEIYSILLWLTAILIISIDLIIYIGSNKISSKLFSIFSFFIAIWSISYGFLISANSNEIPLILIRINHILGLISSIGFLLFSFSYPNDKPISKKIITSLTFFGIIYSYIIFKSDLMIKNMFEVNGPDSWGWNIGKYYFTYSITFGILWFITLFNIFKYSKYTKNLNEYKNQQFMFWGLLLGIIPPFILNIFLPIFKVYGLSWTGPIASAIWIFIIGYSIIKYRQMNVKVVITEMLAVAMTVIFFINIFTKTEFGRLENVLTFLVFFTLATYLIKSILSEEKTKEKLKILNETLEQKVLEQTAEIRKSYELEIQAKRNLEKLIETKNHFILLTQHSIRNPLLNIKLSINEIFDNISVNPPKFNHTKSTIKNNLQRLINITNDFLNIISFDNKEKILKQSNFSPLHIINKIINESKHDIESKNISLKFDNKIENWPKLYIDPEKIYEALLIIIENAIKYNKPNGAISISSKIRDNFFIIQIQDSGYGINKIDKDKILSSTFYRGDRAKILNPNGMGVGLSVAKTIIKSHHGNLSLEKNKYQDGITANITLPINYLKDLIDFEEYNNI